MKDKIINHVIAHCLEMGIPHVTDESDVMKFIVEQPIVFSELLSVHGGYDDVFNVTIIGTMFVGYRGYRMDPEYEDMLVSMKYDTSTVCEVQQRTKLVMYYEKVQDE